MPNKTTISTTEARKNIFKITEDVQKPGSYYTLTENGKPKAVLLSADEHESLIETLEILSDPRAVANIKKAEEEFARGEYVSWDEAKKVLGWQDARASIARDKPKKRYQAKKKKPKKK